MSKYKILQVQGGMKKAGTEAVIMGWYRNIDRKTVQFDFTSYSKEKCEYDDEIKSYGGNIIYIQPRNEIGNIKHFYYLVKLIKENGPYHAVHSHMNFHGGIVCLAAKLAGVKNIVCHAHNTMDENQTIKRKIETWILRKIIINNASALLGCSQVANEFVFKGANNKKVITNAVEIPKEILLNKSDLGNIRKELGVENDCIVLGHVGRFSEQKNHKFFIKLLNRMKERNIKAKMILVGEGELLDAIKDSVNQNNLTDYFKFTGVRNDVIELMKFFDIFLMPSLYEGLPVAMVEAQSVGLPCVVSSNISDEADLGLDIVKYIDLNEDIDLWINAILEMRDKRISSREKIEESLKEKGYNLNANVEKLMEVYNIEKNW